MRVIPEPHKSVFANKYRGMVNSLTIEVCRTSQENRYNVHTIVKGKDNAGCKEKPHDYHGKKYQKSWSLEGESELNSRIPSEQKIQHMR